MLLVNHIHPHPGLVYVLIWFEFFYNLALFLNGNQRFYLVKQKQTQSPVDSLGQRKQGFEMA